MPNARKLRIGVTGVRGLIGWHLRCFLEGRPEVAVVGADRATFGSPEKLTSFVSELDAVVHLAGMNRGEDADIEATNVRLTQEVIDACGRARARPHIVFASSSHIARDTAYAHSKREAAARLRAWADKNGAKCATLVLPHVFGEGGRPFYNSVVSTFCHQLATGESPRIIDDGRLELLHAQRVAEEVLELIRGGSTGEFSMPGSPMRVTELLAALRELLEQYRGHVIPDLRESLRLDLFNTLRSYLYPRRYPVSLRLRTDARGGLFEAVKSLNGGQAFVSSTRPGVVRGNHYHRRKIERFLVVKGRALIRVRKLGSTQVDEFVVDGDSPAYVDIPTLHTHNIANTGSGELLTLFWANEFFDPAAPDTFPEAV